MHSTEQLYGALNSTHQEINAHFKEDGRASAVAYKTVEFILEWLSKPETDLTRPLSDLMAECKAYCKARWKQERVKAEEGKLSSLIISLIIKLVCSWVIRKFFHNVFAFQMPPETPESPDSTV